MTAVRDWDVADDGEIADAALAGDRGAFAQMYERYANRLYDYCLSMVRDRDIAADCVQDTFCIVATRLETLRDADRLRPWLYAIARNEALRRIRERQREQPSDELPDTASNEPGPDTLAARTELAVLISEAAGGLSDRDREVLDLTYRHGLDGPELAEALGVTAAGARTLTHRLRETVERSLGALLVARRSKTGHGCPDLNASLVDWDGEFTMLLRKRIARHIDSCDICLDDRRELVNPRALLGAPLFIPAPATLRDRTLDRVELTCAESAIVGPSAASSAARQERRVLPPPVAALTIAAGIALGITLLWPAATSPPPNPLVETGTMPQPGPAHPQSPTARTPLASLTPSPSINGSIPTDSAPSAPLPQIIPVPPQPVPAVAVPPASPIAPALTDPLPAPNPAPTPASGPIPNPGPTPNLPSTSEISQTPRVGGDSTGTAPSVSIAPQTAPPPTKTYTPSMPSKPVTPPNTTNLPGSLDTSIKPGNTPDSLTSTSGGPSDTSTKPGGPSKSLTSTSGGSSKPGGSSSAGTSSSGGK